MRARGLRQAGRRRLSVFMQCEQYARMIRYYLYILASRRCTDIRIGVTANLACSITAERETTKREKTWHVARRLVYVEALRTADEAVRREQRLRQLSITELARVIETVNPGWDNISLSRLIDAGFGQ